MLFNESVVDNRYSFLLTFFQVTNKNCILQLKIRRDQNHKEMFIELKIGSKHLANDLIHNKRLESQLCI